MARVVQEREAGPIGRLFDRGTVAGMADAQLLERFAGRRDEAAFEALVARHGPLVMGVCSRVLRDPHAAEDAFQATFLVLARKAGSLWVKGSLDAWLSRVATRIALQARADAARRSVLEKDATEARRREHDPSQAIEPDLIPILCQEIDRLPEHYRVPIVLCHLRELTHEAAARELRCPVGTVHGRLSRARELLRRRLTRRGVAFPAAAIAAALVGGESQAACATIPASLLATTARAATNLAAGQAIATSGTSAAVATLVAGALQSMTVRMVKVAAAVGLSLFLAIGASVLAGRGLAGTQEAGGSKTASDVGQRRPDSEAIQGTWSIVELGQVNYQPSEKERAYWKSGQFTMTITADRITLDVDKSGWDYRLAPTKTPRQMMLTVDDPRRGKVVSLAIYSLDGDDLKICIGRSLQPGSPPEAPASFDIKAAPRGTSPVLWVMKRKGTQSSTRSGQPAKDAVAARAAGAPAVANDPLHWVFDRGYSLDLPGAEDEPLFVDLDNGRFMTPPSGLGAGPGSPLALSDLVFSQKLKGWIRDQGIDATVQPNRSLAFSQKLRDWIRDQGIDAAVRTDGRIVSLIGLESERAGRLPRSSAWSLTPAEALEGINRRRVEDSRRGPSEAWPRFTEVLQEAPREDGTYGLPFMTREGGIGVLSLRMDPRPAPGKDAIRLDCRIARGLDLRFEGRPRSTPARKIPEPSILGPLASGTLNISVRDGKIVLERAESPEQLEVGQGKVVVRAGGDPSSKVLLEARQLGTPLMRLDGPGERVVFPSKGTIMRRDREELRLFSPDGRILSARSMSLTLPLPGQDPPVADPGGSSTPRSR